MIFKAGDLEPPLRARFLDGNGNPVDVSSGFTITVRIYKPDNTTEIISGQAVPEDGSEIVGSNGWAEHVWAGSETATPGDYRAEFIATATTRDRTFPGSAWAAYTIEPVLAADPPTTIVWGQVVAYAAEVADVDPIIRQLILEHVNGDGVNADAFGGEGAAALTMARVMLAAHHAVPALQTTTSDGAAGPVIREQVGGLSVAYADVLSSIAGGDSLYSTTTYGRAFMNHCRAQAYCRFGWVF